MTREEIRVECLRLALECREAGQGAGEMVAVAAALEGYVCEKTPARVGKARHTKGDAAMASPSVRQSAAA